MARYKNKTLLTSFWQENFLSEDGRFCGLCGNKGVVDTTKTAFLADGTPVGGVYFCVCPNGRAMVNEIKEE